MKWFSQSRTGLGALLAALVIVGCNDGDSSTLLAPAGNDAFEAAAATVYDQMDFLGNPLVSEVTVVKANHDGYNQTMPYTSNVYRPQTEAFVKSFGRSQGLATTLGSVLYPDMLIVDPSKSPATSGWLTWALSAGWGGRNLSDDVVDLGLTAIFSSFLDPNNALCAPFTLPLCTDNIAGNDKAFLGTFPYLATPHTAY